MQTESYLGGRTASFRSGRSIKDGAAQRVDEVAKESSFDRVRFWTKPTVANAWARGKAQHMVVGQGNRIYLCPIRNPGESSPRDRQALAENALIAKNIGGSVSGAVRSMLKVLLWEELPGKARESAAQVRLSSYQTHLIENAAARAFARARKIDAEALVEFTPTRNEHSSNIPGGWISSQTLSFLVSTETQRGSENSVLTAADLELRRASLFDSLAALFQTMANSLRKADQGSYDLTDGATFEEAVARAILFRVNVNLFKSVEFLRCLQVDITRAARSQLASGNGWEVTASTGGEQLVLRVLPWERPRVRRTGLTATTRAVVPAPLGSGADLD